MEELQFRVQWNLVNITTILLAFGHGSLKVSFSQPWLSVRIQGESKNVSAPVLQWRFCSVALGRGGGALDVSKILKLSG